MCTSNRGPSPIAGRADPPAAALRSEEHTSELQSRSDLVCRLLLEKKKKTASTQATQTHRGSVLRAAPDWQPNSRTVRATASMSHLQLDTLATRRRSRRTHHAYRTT